MLSATSEVPATLNNATSTNRSVCAFPFLLWKLTLELDNVKSGLRHISRHRKCYSISSFVLVVTIHRRDSKDNPIWAGENILRGDWLALENRSGGATLPAQKHPTLGKCLKVALRIFEE